MLTEFLRNASGKVLHLIPTDLQWSGKHVLSSYVSGSVQSLRTRKAYATFFTTVSLPHTFWTVTEKGMRYEENKNTNCTLKKH